MSNDAHNSAEALKKRVRTVLSGQKQETVTVLSSLLAVQDELHYIPDVAIEETAVFAHSTTNEVWSVASFYTNFRFTPPGNHIVEVCWGPSCHLLGAQTVLKTIQDNLGIDGEGETEDGSVSLSYSTCLGACAHAPVIAIDHCHRGRVTPQTASDAVSKLKFS